MLRSPKIQSLIQKYESQAKASVHNAAQRFIQEKITRADYDVRDFIEIKNYTNEKTGEPKTAVTLKELETMTRDQIICIDGVDVKGQGAPVYTLPDRQKERDSVIALDRVWNGSGNEAGQDVEEIRELIIERVTLRQEKRVKMAETAETADFEIIETPRGEGSEEL
jgi:hypothetical protein